MRAAAKTPFYATALFWVIVSPVAATALIVAVVHYATRQKTTVASKTPEVRKADPLPGQPRPAPVEVKPNPPEVKPPVQPTPPMPQLARPEPVKPAERPIVPLPPPVDPFPEGSRLFNASKWWTTGATPDKLQRLVDELGKNASVSILFNSKGDFTRFRGFFEWMDRIKRRPYGFDDYEVISAQGKRTLFDFMLHYTDRHEEDVPDISVIESGHKLQLRFVSNDGKGRELTKKQLADLIEDQLAEKPVSGSGQPSKFKLSRTK